MFGTLAMLMASLASTAARAEETPAPVPVRVILLDWERTTGAQVVGHLRPEVPELVVESSSRALSAEDLLSRPARREALVLLELEAARITAVRTDRRTVITRAFAPGTGRDAPYSFAVATLELIDIAAERRPAPAPPLPPSPASWALALGVGPSFTAGLGTDPSLVQLAVGADLLLRTAGRGGWWAVGPRARLFGSAARAPVIGSERFELSLARQDLALRSAVGLSFGAVDLGLAVSGGVSLTYSETTPATAGSSAPGVTPSGFVGPGIEARYALGAGFGVALSVDGLLMLAPLQYLIRDEVVVEEGRLRTVVALSLVWQSGAEP